MRFDESTVLRNNFKISIGKESFLNVKRISGLDSEVQVLFLDDGGSSDGQKNVRGTSNSSGFLTLVVDSCSHTASSLWEWYESVCDTTRPLEKKSVKVELIDANTKKSHVIWKISNAWPCRWNGPDLDKNDKGVSLESISLCFETIRRERGNS